LTTAVQPRRLTLGGRAAEWISRYCVYPSGPMVGRPFRLTEWQKDFLNDLYDCDESGNLTYRWALLGVAKGNGKSPLLACDALFHMLGDPYEADPYIVCAATTDRQADIVFQACKTMCELSQPLREATLRYRWEIHAKAGRGKIERLAASKGRQDGKLASKLYADELHEWEEENWVILTGAARKRARSQIVQATTAGFDRESRCYLEYMRGQKGQDGYLFRWYSGKEGVKHDDRENWRAANPSLGTIITEDMLQDAYNSLPESQFRRYHLNEWTDAEEIWLPPGAWEACKVESFEIEKGFPTFVAIDASTKHDSTAVVTGQWVEDKLRVKAKIWERPLDPSGNPVEDWGIPFNEVENYIRWLWRDIRAREINYDPAFITWMAQSLADEGAPMQEFPQSDTRMIPATQTTYDAILDRTFVHDGDPVLARHLRSAMAVQTSRGGQRLTKGKQRRIHNMIDGAVALTMMGYRAMIWDRPPNLLPIGNTVGEDDKRPEFSGIRGQGF
jgi:phage terminase large subunit-like protein